MPGPHGEQSPYMDAFWEEQRKIADAVFKDIPRHEPFAAMRAEVEALTKQREAVEEQKPS